jgi:hypothetical protein
MEIVSILAERLSSFLLHLLNLILLKYSALSKKYLKQLMGGEGKLIK